MLQSFKQYAIPLKSSTLNAFPYKLQLSFGIGTVYYTVPIPKGNCNLYGKALSVEDLSIRLPNAAGTCGNENMA